MQGVAEKGSWQLDNLRPVFNSLAGADIRTIEVLESALEHAANDVTQLIEPALPSGVLGFVFTSVLKQEVLAEQRSSAVPSASASASMPEEAVSRSRRESGERREGKQEESEREVGREGAGGRRKVRGRRAAQRRARTTRRAGRPRGARTRTRIGVG